MRRLGAICCLILWSLTGGIPAAHAAEPYLKLWYEKPATQWQEALPIGNGRLGCMVFGGVDAERLQLNEGSVWSGSPQDSDNPSALAARLGDHAALLRDTKAMFLPMVDSPPGTLWEDPTGAPGFALCHSIACGVGGILTEEVLGIRLGFPLKITPHNGGTLRWCKGFITTPKGRVQVAWESQKDRYQLQASIPKGITAEVVLPPEAKAVWQSAPAKDPWRETLTVSGNAMIVVLPGIVKAKS